MNNHTPKSHKETTLENEVDILRQEIREIKRDRDSTQVKYVKLQRDYDHLIVLKEKLESNIKY